MKYSKQTCLGINVARAKQQRKLQNHLLLNRYISSLFGFKKLDDFRRKLDDIPEEINQNGKFYFTEVLQNLNICDELRQKLEQYDENIQEYLNKINEKRETPILLKYYQYLAVLFTELYLDKYYNEFDVLYDELINYAEHMREVERDKNVPYPKENGLNKLVYWAATGSGKTIIMHINYLQIIRYNKTAYDNVLLITPGESLTAQHMVELSISNIKNKRFEVQRTFDDWMVKDPVKVIDNYKIKQDVKTQDGKSVPVEFFGENNIVFVDEGHKGSGGNEWKSNRESLVGKHGFIFEYSATFGEVAADDDLFEEYSTSIIFDYRYKYFYEDGFGKDYSILNLRNKNDYDNDEYLLGALLSLYEQKKYLNDNSRGIRKFKLENPLMIFVGSSVSGKKTDSDVLNVVKFIAKYVNEDKSMKQCIKNIFTNNSSIIDEHDQPIFNRKFSYLRELIRNHQLNIDEIYDNVISDLFYVKSSKILEFVDIKKAEGEIGLRFGHDADYFGVINIGDTASFIKLAESENESEYFKTDIKSNLEKTLFGKIENKNSKINFLIGSKKFIEGWNSYRVSSMCLLNIGKKEGAQIIQLFGRGVRLRGYENSLKRSQYLKDHKRLDDSIIVPEKLEILETLNIFGMNANYMDVFRETLKGEGIAEYETFKLKIKPTLPGFNLYIPRKSKDAGEFKDEVQITTYNNFKSTVGLDLRSKIERIDSKDKIAETHGDSTIKELMFTDEIVSMMDFDRVYLEIMKYKGLKKYGNMYFTKKDLIELINKKSYYIRCKEEILEITKDHTLEKLHKLEDYAIQLLKSMLDKIYGQEKQRWYQKNLSYEVLDEQDHRMIPEEYVFTINCTESDLKWDMNEFTDTLIKYVRKNASSDDDVLYSENSSFGYDEATILEFFANETHLFQPLIYKNEDERLKFIKLSPTALVESERKFLNHLTEYIERNKDNLPFDRAYLLRNPSRTGIGFFETKGFYPDFILWTIKGDKQSIAFIDPKGLMMMNQDDEKLRLYEDIKQIQDSINKRGDIQLNLNAFITSVTNYRDLKTQWDATKDELEDKNILFLEDGHECIRKMFNKIRS